MHVLGHWLYEILFALSTDFAFRLQNITLLLLTLKLYQLSHKGSTNKSNCISTYQNRIIKLLEANPKKKFKYFNYSLSHRIGVTFQYNNNNMIKPTTYILIKLRYSF